MSDSETSPFASPTNLKHNRGLIDDPAAFAESAGAASWLYLCGEEFAGMEGGMSYADVQAAVPESVNVIADPPRPFDMDVARAASPLWTNCPGRRLLHAARGRVPRRSSISIRACSQVPRPMRCSRAPRRTALRSLTTST